MEHVALDIAKTLKEKIAGLKLGLSTVAQKGDEKLSETVAIEGDPDDIRRSQLYIGELVEQRSHGTCGLIAVDRSTCQHRFGGFMMYVQLLLEGGADANHRNEGTLWTPLHAAAFQEHGKVHGKVMSHYSMTYVVTLLIQDGANPLLEDSVGRTPADFASASQKIWPHFAAAGCIKCTRPILIEKGIIKKITSYSRPGSAYAIQAVSTKQHYDSRAMVACLGGDILALEGEVISTSTKNSC